MTDTVDTNSEFDQLTADTPTRISTPMAASGGPPPGWNQSKTNGGTLNLPRAQHIVRKLTDDPSWLIDPSTSHAAQAVFGAASKVIGMNIQLESASARSEAAKAKNSIAGRVGQSLLKLAETGEVGAGIAAKWYALDSDGKPLYENPANASRIFEDYKAHVVGAPEPMSMSLDDGTEVQGWIDPKTRKFTQYKPSSGTGPGTSAHRPVADTLTFADGKKVNVVYGPSGAPTVIKDGKEADDAHQKGLQDVAKSDLLDARKAVHKATTVEERELALKGYDSAKRNFDAVFRPKPASPSAASTNAPAASASATSLPMPATKSDLKSGQRYLTPRGEATWDGEKFVQ